MPTTLAPGTSPVPTGHYQIPFNQSEEINQCIPNPDVMGAAWGCMDIAYIGVNVFEDQVSGNYQAAFEDFSVNTADFRYGPQPPDFNGTAFMLQPMVDTDASDLGAAMFFSVLFDKLSISEYHIHCIWSTTNVTQYPKMHLYSIKTDEPLTLDNFPAGRLHRTTACPWHPPNNHGFASGTQPSTSSSST